MSEILLDYDGRLPARLLERVERVGRLCRWGIRGIGFAKSKHGWHVTVVTRKTLHPLAVVAAQSVLGSDAERETFNLVRASVLCRAPAFWRQKGRWNVFYRRKL